MSTASGGEPPFLRHWRAHGPKRRRPTRVWLLGGVVVAVVAAALIVVEVDPWSTSSRPEFSPCTHGGRVAAMCTTIAVPEDPADHGGRRISLRVAVLPATRQPREGALFYLEGGPGGAATAAALRVNELFAQEGRTRDIVMVDQRGTGGSNPLACPSERVPATDSAAVAGYLRSCFPHRPAEAQLYTTSLAADDLEAVRRRLGYGRIDVYGGSYGATLAETYLRQFPRSVRSVVLDSASLPNVRLYERSARNAELALEALFARCAATPACRRAFPQPRAELDRLLHSGPRKVTIETGKVLLRPDDVATIVATLLQTPEDAAWIPSMIHAAVGGDYVPLARTYARDLGADLDPRARLQAFWVILCSEPWAGFDPAATERAGAGSFLASAATARALLFRRACRAVPRGRVPADAARIGVSDAPVLLLTGAADPLDPVSNLRGWRRAFPNGRLVIVPGAAHGVIDRGCVPKLVAEFVARADAHGLDTACVDHQPTIPFETG